MSSIGDVFPSSDPVARFVVAMGIARNDIEHALHLTVRANQDEHPSFHYHWRIVTGHTAEAARALQHWRRLEVIQQFPETLPQAAKSDLATVSGMTQRVGGAPLEQARNRTFHYPYPTERYTPNPDTELAEVLDTLAPEEANLVVAEENPLRIRFEFSDRAALMLALERHDPDEARLTQQLTHSRDGGAAFVRFADSLFAAYRDARGLTFGD